jgi:two-component system, response regulator YesN
MYKLLIVDDEPIIADSLQLLFNGIQTLPLKVFAVYNAYEAIDVLKKEQIDIVLTDIQMPGMNGIELHKKICQEWKQCKTVFLTGFNDFSYAQQILRNGGSIDYVLKNEDDDVIVEAIQKAINLKEQENQEKERKKQNEEKVNRALPILQREFFNQLINHPNKEVEQSKLQELEVPFYVGRPFFIALGIINTDGNQGVDINKLNECIKIKLEDEDSYHMCHFSYQNSKSMYLFQPKAWKDNFDASTQMNSYTEQLMKILEKFTLSFYLYAEPITWGIIHNCLYEINMKLFNSSVNDRVTLVKKEDVSTLVIAKLHLYISEHLNEDLSLQTLAEYIAHSPTYLSKLYKRKTGKSLSLYITEQRMNQGKTLLINTNKKIYEIAAEIGYEQQYFIRYFKKMYGITPQQYREKAGYNLIVNQAAHH